MLENNKILVVKVGGSIMSTSENELFSFKNAENLKLNLDSFAMTGSKFALCLGGGYLCRKFQKLLDLEGYGKNEQHDIGVASINMLAVMLKSVFGDMAEDRILRYEDYDQDSPINFDRSFMIAAAGSSGHSGDMNALKIALRLNSKVVISLKNIDGVYSADPNKDASAKRIDHLSWQEYLQIIGNPIEHVPGASYPVDPLASRLAEDKGVKFYVIKGDDYENLRCLLNGDKFIGSIIG
jgi:uridylate kinase